jgi:hypothetical protein
MPSALAKEVLEKAKAHPKTQILHQHTASEAFRIAKHMFKADDAWAEQFTASQKSHAFGFLSSRLLIKNKILVYTLIIGDSVLGEKFPYDKGYKLYNEALDKN